METTSSAQPSKGNIWTGRVISIICVLFLLFDAGGKIFKESHSVAGTLALGFTENHIAVIGTILLICTIIFIIPRTAIIGAILLTAYLGGAVAIMLRAGVPLYFPVVFGILIWLGLYLRDKRVSALIK
jgi:hypothetical protein